MESIRKNSFDSPEYDPAYVRARELAAAEKEAEEKAKAALLHFSKQDHSHEMVMKNGFMVPKSTDSSPARPQAGTFHLCARLCSSNSRNDRPFVICSEKLPFFRPLQQKERAKPSSVSSRRQIPTAPR